MPMTKGDLLLVLAGCAVLLPAAVHAAAGGLRDELLRTINAERQKAGVPALRLQPALTEVAQQHAEEIALSGRLQLPRSSNEKVWTWMQQAGYTAHEWTEGFTASTGDPGRLVLEWRQRNRSVWASALRPEVRDVGIGLAEMDGVPLYAFLFAVPEAEHFARSTRGLNDAGRVRAEMLAAVNALRQKAGAPPLTLDASLTRAAQDHAEDMLARGYFAHESPSGTSVADRAHAAGYAWSTVGENIAEGQTSVHEVVTTWMNSPGHRRNLLNPDFHDLGIGLATGPTGRGAYRVVWVQNFGAR